MSARDVVVVGVPGAQERLAKAGVTDIAVVDDCDLGAAVFDEDTHTWTLPTCRARIVVTNQIRCGRDNLAPYLGVAVHGAPNYFTVTGDAAVAGARLDYIAEVLDLMRRTSSTRIEVLFSTQRMFHLRGTDWAARADARFWRHMANKASTAFDLSSHIGAGDDLYDGSATLRAGDDEYRVRVRLTGRLDPIDGRYHWQGTVFGALPDDVLTQPRPVAMTVGERTVECRITERTPQGRFSVVGVGTPPYAIPDLEIDVGSR